MAIAPRRREPQRRARASASRSSDASVIGCRTTIRWSIPSSSYAAIASASSSTGPSNARSSPSCPRPRARPRVSDLDAHGAFDRRGVPALRRERRVERPKALAQTFVRRPEPRRVPRVGVAGGQPQHPRAERGHQDRDVARRRGFEHRVPRRDVVALERHGLASQQRGGRSGAPPRTVRRGGPSGSRTRRTPRRATRPRGRGSADPRSPRRRSRPSWPRARGRGSSSTGPACRSRRVRSRRRGR